MDSNLYQFTRTNRYSNNWIHSAADQYTESTYGDPGEDRNTCKYPNSIKYCAAADKYTHPDLDTGLSL